MTSFDYECPLCGSIVRDKCFKDYMAAKKAENDSDLICPECSTLLKKLYSAQPVHFKYNRATSKSKSSHAIK